MTSFKIGKRCIGSGEKVFVIAEAGSNHNRDLKQAKQLIDEAVDSGADAVKFQTYTSKGLYSKKTPKPEYLKNITDEDETLSDLISKIELPPEFQSELYDHCKEQSIMFLSTPFEERAVDELSSLGVEAYKIASFEIGHIPLLKHAGKEGKPMIISTGMASMGDIEEAMDAIRSVGNSQIALLHCDIGYPPPMNDVNLRAIPTLSQAFQVPVGFSDHTMSTSISASAVALGACIIEKHFTLDRNMEGPDHPFALEPNELKKMIKNIRDVEAALGSPIKKISESEKELYRIGRRSIVAKTDILAGDVITADMLSIKRPGYGIPPKFLEIVIGKTARINMEEDTIITWDMI